MKLCKIEECGRKHYTRGYCRMHFLRLKKTGDLGPVHRLKGKGSIKICECGKKNTEFRFEKNRSLCIECFRKSERCRAGIYYDKHTVNKNIYSKKYRESIEIRFKTSTWQANKRNISWSLSFEEFCNLVNKPCTYCNNKLGKIVLSGSGLDRIDNSRGYELNNVQPCCASCNKLRSNQFTIFETHAMVNAVIKLRNL